MQVGIDKTQIGNYTLRIIMRGVDFWTIFYLLISESKDAGKIQIHRLYNRLNHNCQKLMKL